MPVTGTYDALLRNSKLPRLEARQLLQQASGKRREWLIAHGDQLPPQTIHDAFSMLCRRRLAGEPMAYLTGSALFMDREYQVTPDVLIPRPETEVLVTQIVARSPRHAPVLEMGCGSGIICVSVGLARPDLKLTATDIDAGALAVARANAAAHNCDQIRFCQGDWYAALADEPGTSSTGSREFAVIAANPPYIEANDPHLAADGLPFEPQHALASGADGLDAIRHIAREAARHLVAGGLLLVEHGYNQHDAVHRIFTGAGLDRPWSVRDEAGHWRVSGAFRAGQAVTRRMSPQHPKMSG